MIRKLDLVSAALCSALVIVPACVQAQSWGEEYAKRLRSAQNVAPLTGDVFGESVSLFNGTVSFHVTDVSLPGNNNLPVAVSRRWNTGDELIVGDVFGRWSHDIPHLSGVFGGVWTPSQRCSTTSPPERVGDDGAMGWDYNEFWSGNQLVLPGGGGGEMLAIENNPKAVRPQIPGLSGWTTRNNWYFTCLPSLKNGSGEGFVGHAPDGTKYYFDWQTMKFHSGIERPGFFTGTYPAYGPVQLDRYQIRLNPTLIEDRHGNWVKYEWTGSNLTRVHSSDGREITIEYDASGKVTKATAAGRI